MNQTHWRNGQTIGDILDLLAYSPLADNESTRIEGQPEGNQPHRVDERQADREGAQNEKADRRTMKRPRRIA